MADVGRTRACVEVGEFEVHGPGDGHLLGSMAVTEREAGGNVRKLEKIRGPMTNREVGLHGHCNDGANGEYCNA